MTFKTICQRQWSKDFQVHWLAVWVILLSHAFPGPEDGLQTSYSRFTEQRSPLTVRSWMVWLITGLRGLPIRGAAGIDAIKASSHTTAFLIGRVHLTKTLSKKKELCSSVHDFWCSFARLGLGRGWLGRELPPVVCCMEEAKPLYCSGNVKMAPFKWKTKWVTLSCQNLSPLLECLVSEFSAWQNDVRLQLLDAQGAGFYPWLPRHEEHPGCWIERRF